MKTKQGLDIISNFYLDINEFELVYKKLQERFKKSHVQNKMDDLKLERAELENDSIRIDNDLKNYWECKYCGSANYGSDSKCAHCGSSRQVIKLKIRGGNNE